MLPQSPDQPLNLRHRRVIQRHGFPAPPTDPPQACRVAFYQLEQRA
jgi:hypothetical protein